MLDSLALTLAAVTTKPQTAPIAVEHCSFVQSASYSRGVRIRFKNSGDAPATLVVFKVEQGKYATALIDEGTFRPGETIDHVMTSVPLTLWRGEKPTLCAVTHVHFADGTSWGR